jgi:hypothetical protein
LTLFSFSLKRRTVSSGVSTLSWSNVKRLKASSRTTLLIIYLLSPHFHTVSQKHVPIGSVKETSALAGLAIVEPSEGSLR